MTKPTATKLTGIRHIADLGACYLALTFSVLGLIQIFLAGSGVFGRDFDMHVTLGRILSALAIVILILALTARHSRRAIISAVILVLLAVIATSVLANLGWTSMWLGGLHALAGIVSVLIAEQMGRRVFRKSN